MIGVDLPRAAGEVRREDVELVIAVLERLRSLRRVWLVRAEPCPTCRVGAGEPCRLPRGQRRRMPHARRQDRAIRTYNEATPQEWRRWLRYRAAASVLAEIARCRLYELALADGRLEHVLPSAAPPRTTWSTSEVLA